MTEPNTETGEGFTKTSAPALRALPGTGYTELPQLTAAPESELAKLHGIGPKALRILREALAERGLTFRN